MKLLKNEWGVQEVSLITATAFAEKWHYAHGAGGVATKCFGLFYKGDPKTLHGIAAWNPPPPGASKSVDGDNPHSVLGLSRFCLVEGRPENAGSFLIARGIKLLDKRRWQTLLTYADTAENHNGGLYRASNWNYEGLTKKNPRYWDPINNKMVSKKQGPNNYNRAQMLEKGYEFQGNFAKHKFIYPLKRRGLFSQSVSHQLELNFTEKGKIVIKNKNNENTI